MKTLKQKGVKLKEANRQQIKDFFLLGSKTNDIQGMKLQALYKLIQNKGVEITEAEQLKRFEGVKALFIGDGFYIAIKRTAVNKGSFYPCKLESAYLQEL